MKHYRVFATFSGEMWVAAATQEEAEAQVARHYGPSDFFLTLQSVEIVASADATEEAA